MAADPLIGKIDGLVRSIKLAASVATAARLQSDTLQLDDSLQGLVAEIAAHATDGALANAGAADLVEVENYIRTQLRQALELIESPADACGWCPTDLALIDEQGKASGVVVREIEAFAERHSHLKHNIANGRGFLDVGTGAGWIAIEAARRWPGMKVTGIDIWEPSVALAQSNVAARGLSGRVHIERRDITAIEFESCFDIVWLPAPFLPGDVLIAALPRIHKALVPGGTVVVGIEREPQLPLDRLLAQLDARRLGGHYWKDGQLRDALAASGFEELGEFSLMEPLQLVAGRRGS